MPPSIPLIRSIRDLPLKNRRVFVRVDFNVPFDVYGNIQEDSRIQKALPTLQYVLEQGARLILASHLGKPPFVAGAGSCSEEDKKKYSLEPCGIRLAELLGCEVHMPEDSIGPSAKKVVHDLRKGQVCLLENLRFYPEEQANDVLFARCLAQSADIYVNDAFATMHRAHASIAALALQFRDKGYGLLVEQELSALERMTAGQEHPYVAILGGSKVSDKIDLIEMLFTKIDTLLIGGAMANTFLAAQGHPMGASRIEEDKLPQARSILEKAEAQGIGVLLPSDVVVGNERNQKKEGTVCSIGKIPSEQMALDIGPQTLYRYGQAVEKAKLIFWNGPVGFFENPQFAKGTLALATHVAQASAFSVVGGGDTAGALSLCPESVQQGFDHVCTGGGAALTWMQRGRLPGLEALR